MQRAPPRHSDDMSIILSILHPAGESDINPSEEPPGQRLHTH